ncbi:phage tail tape measure protein [Vibrio hepatarius]|uniref:phage tail tape measure protein n=1 Tax=Vibrio hepatarius TaxID=171383 RepID=UPI00148B402C|nr:phage tail tape measure protein [Vibrio hepatarius]NOI14840.1 phage tail tape measure protein [Vibrio hepatarius]
MAQRLETDIVLNLAGNLASKARQYGNSMATFAQKNQRAMRLLKTSTDAAGRGIDTLGNRYVGLATTLATGAAVRNVGNFQAQMTRIGTDAKLADEQVAALTKTIEDLSTQSDVRINTSQLASGVNALLGKTGDFEFVNENLENMGLFMQAFGADAESTGAIFAQFRAKGIRDSEAVMKTIDELYGQFAIGSVSVQDLASISEQLFSTYQGKGPEAIAQMGALVQLFATAKGNANESLTSIQAVFATFSDKKKVEFLSKQGIEVFKEGTRQLREPVELLLEILDKAKNDPLKLGDVFDQTSLQGLASLYDVANKELLQDMVSGTAEMGATQAAAAKNAATMNSAVVSLNNSFNKFANERLADPIMELADAINSVDDETVQNWLKWGEAGLWAIGGVIAAKKSFDVAMKAKGAFDFIMNGKKKRKGKDGIGELGAQPVYVVNMPGGGFGGVDSSGGGKGKSGKSGRSLKGVRGMGAASALGVLGLLGSAKDYDPSNPMFTPISFPSNTPKKSTDMDEAIKRFNQGMSGNRTSPWATAGQAPNGNVRLQIDVSDDRVKVTPKYVPPGFTVDPDTGAN